MQASTATYGGLGSSVRQGVDRVCLGIILLGHRVLVLQKVGVALR